MAGPIHIPYTDKVHNDVIAHGSVILENLSRVVVVGVRSADGTAFTVTGSRKNRPA